MPERAEREDQMLNFENSEKKHKESMSWFVPCIVIAFLIYVLLMVQGCANTVRGLSQTVQAIGTTVRGAGIDAEEALNNQMRN